MQSDEAFKGKLKSYLQNNLPKKLIFVWKVNILGLIDINKETGLAYRPIQKDSFATKQCLPSIFLIFLSVLKVLNLYWHDINESQMFI